MIGLDEQKCSFFVFNFSVWNGFNKVTFHATLPYDLLFHTIVEDILEPPVFVEAPQSVQLVKGEAIKLACKAKGKPVPKITWMKDGVKMKKGRLLLLSLLENKERLEVDSEVQLSEVTPTLTQGVYTIEAENAAGKATHTMEITGRNSGF